MSILVTEVFIIFLSMTKNTHISTTLDSFSMAKKPTEAKFHMKPPLAGSGKVYVNGCGHMTKITVKSVYGEYL